MAQERDELNRRRQAREAARKKREAARRKLYFRLIAAALILVVCGVAMFLMARGDKPQEPEQEVMVTVAPVQTVPAETEEEAASWERPPEVITIAAAGDLNVTDSVVWCGQEGTAYDYTKAFMDVAPILSEADLTVLNYEGTVSGIPYGGAEGSAPPELITALKNAGVDLLQTANSCAVNRGFSGLVSTLSSIRAAGIEPVGAFSNYDEFSRSKGYTICEVGDVKVALVAFTKGMSGRGLPEGNEECVNLLYKDYSTTYREINTEGIKSILKAASNESPDIIIALLHWGSEYNEDISESQEDIRDLMLAEGVDVILGTHSHLLQKIEYDDNTGQLVAYSLGDFFGDGKRSGTSYSIILELEITKDYDTGVTRVTDYSYTPIYTLKEADCDGDRRVVRIENAVSAYEMNFVDKITESCYNDMLFSLKRIEARVSGKEDNAKEVN